MKYLSQGLETKERLVLLFSLTRIQSESLKSALHDFLVTGFEESVAVSINSVTQSNFNRALKNLNSIAETVERIKEIDIHKSVK